jgi:adenylyltransferase/sulfurtransferase
MPMPREITPRALSAALASGEAVRLLDVRQPWESQLASLPGSLLIPLGELPARSKEVGSPGDSRLVVYCHHGVRSQSAAVYLERLGYDNVHSLAGGIDAWSCEIDPAVPRY